MRSRHDERTAKLTRAFVEDTDDGHLRDGRVWRHQLFDFARGMNALEAAEVAFEAVQALVRKVGAAMRRW